MRLHTGCIDYCKRVCSESWLWEKNPLLFQVTEPVPAVFWSDALLPELQPIPQTCHSLLYLSACLFMCVCVCVNMNVKCELFWQLVSCSHTLLYQCIMFQEMELMGLNVDIVCIHLFHNGCMLIFPFSFPLSERQVHATLTRKQQATLSRFKVL